MRVNLRMLFLACLLVGSSAGAADDDLLAPLTPPEATKPKPKKKPKHSPDPEAPLAGPSQLVVTLPTDISGARLYVDGVDLGLLPGPPVPLSPGSHKVQVRRMGFREYAGSVMVKPAGNTWFAVTLEPVGGVLSVQADVAGAEISLDGKRAGPAPLQALVLSPGTHDVVVSRPGYDPETSRLLVRAGKDYTLRAHLVATTTAARERADVPRAHHAPSTATLTPADSASESLSLEPPTDTITVANRPWYSRWYVWAGIGAVAVGGGVTAAILTNHPKPIAPSAVCGGPCDGTVNAPSAIHF